MIRDIEAIGKRQHVTFKIHVFQIDKGVQSPIKRTEIPVFQFHTTNKKSSTAKKLEWLKYGASLFSRSYFLVMRANYINSPYLIRGYWDLVKSLILLNMSTFCCTRRRNSFQLENIWQWSTYAIAETYPFLYISTVCRKRFDPIYLCRINLNTVDIVWDQYLDNSLTNRIRDKRGEGVIVKVSPQTAVPRIGVEALSTSSNINEVIKTVLKFLLFFYKKILQAQKSTKGIKSTKSTKSIKTQPSKGIKRK